MPFAFSRHFSSDNISWHSPSRDSMHSMPLSGRLGAGANVWVQDGPIWIYLGHHSAYCWYQGNIFTARLGLTAEARDRLLRRDPRHETAT